MVVELLKKGFALASKVLIGCLTLIVVILVLAWTLSGDKAPDQQKAVEDVAPVEESVTDPATEAIAVEEREENLVFSLLTTKEWESGPKEAGWWKEAAISCKELPKKYSGTLDAFFEVASGVASTHGHAAPDSAACQIKMHRHNKRGWSIALQFFPSIDQMAVVNVATRNKDMSQLVSYSSPVLNFQISEKGGIDLMAIHKGSGEEWFRRHCFLPSEELSEISWEANCGSVEWDMRNPPKQPLREAAVDPEQVSVEANNSGRVKLADPGQPGSVIADSASSESAEQKERRRREWSAKCSRYRDVLLSCASAGNIDECIKIRLGTAPTMENIYCAKSGEPLFHLMGL